MPAEVGLSLDLLGAVLSGTVVRQLCGRRCQGTSHVVLTNVLVESSWPDGHTCGPTVQSTLLEVSGQ